MHLDEEKNIYYENSNLLMQSPEITYGKLAADSRFLKKYSFFSFDLQGSNKPKIIYDKVVLLCI